MKEKAMTVITANQELQHALAGLREKTEVRDASGNLLGYFTPRQVEEELLYRYAEETFDPDEIRRRSAAKSKGFTIEEVMAHLKSLEKP
jgi:hypothetical protein